MVKFSKLSMTNFKRFSGENHIPLMGTGRVTVIAAKNGLGKTTIMDAIHVSLYGRKGFSQIYPGKNFQNWILNAHSVDADDSGKVALSLQMEDPVLGPVRISRTYWLPFEEGGSIEEEAGITIRGKPLQKLPGETAKSLVDRWIEDYLPQAAMTRFLVDGEKLSHLDPKNIDKSIVEGIDDATGIGLLHRLQRRLRQIKTSTLKTLAPEDQQESVNFLMDLYNQYISDMNLAISELEDTHSKIEGCTQRIEEIQHEIEQITREGGSENVQLRMDYAIRQSELTSSRREVQNHLTEALPFVIAGLPSNLSEWGIEKTIEFKKAERRASENLEFLNSVIEATQLGSRTRKKLISEGARIASNPFTEASGPLAYLDMESIEMIIKRHAELGISDARERVSEALTEAMKRLNAFETSEDKLRNATAGTGISAKADELKELSRELGSLQAETARLKGVISQSKSDSSDVEKRIDEIRQRENEDSLLNRRITRIEHLQKLNALVTKQVRKSFASPLESSFKEGFELLSRKSGRLEEVSIDTNDYSTRLSMRGFEGNWLDRDLSATERQHVGLALIFALRRASTEFSMPLPVIIDTPTSRMDTEHKSWSVTKFYPQLSQQVVVLATSDDLAGGLFEELEETGVLGAQVLVSEVSENSVKANESNLKTFFGGA